MNIYIDESGSFVNTPTAGAWNAVAALAVPEASRRRLAEVLQELHRSKLRQQAELKLNDLSEDTYLGFVEKVNTLDLALFCTVTDAGLNTKDRVQKHQAGQVDAVLEHIDKMKYGVDPLSWTLFNDGIREVHDAPQSRCIPAGIPAEDGRAGPVWT